MDKLIIVGEKKLKGTVSVKGAKNSVLPILAATLLSEEPSTLKNVPCSLRDIQTMMRILKSLGVSIEADSDTIRVTPKGYEGWEAPYKFVSTMRASVCLLGPLLAKQKRARVSLPGGCVIGPRPIDLHLKGIRAIGGEITLAHGYIHAKAKVLHGTHVYLGGSFGSSVLATANVLMAATLAKGTTIIEDASCEPEVVDLAQFLTKMGAKIQGIGSKVLEVEGVRSLHGAEHAIISDRIEAGTYLFAGAITRGDITVRHARTDHLGAVIDKLREAGVQITEEKGGIRVQTPKSLRPIDVTTLPYPGFPTDLQAQATALMSVTDGISIITEKIYPDRFMHVSEMARMGAQIVLEGPSAIVKGVRRLSGAPVMASDLRASAALILAGLVAKGKTEVARIYHLERGYEKMEARLASLGAEIWREKEK
ncbi:MAG: UDP-N-acetylglucosamine 1-carboxyvinyltransferase [Candidatus Omnitrophica bacterium]|nr:UDP-N-acetylglucosamine 1-carboxyvinyltransferase [Candidatus Omnitrophota bacterium]